MDATPLTLTLEIDADRPALEQPLESPTVQLVATEAPLLRVRRR